MPLMVVPKDLIIGRNIAACYRFKQLYSSQPWKEQYMLEYFIWQSIAYSEGSTNFMGMHQSSTKLDFSFEQQKSPQEKESIM